MSNIIGQRFGRLVVKEFSYQEKGKYDKFYLCKCDCGNTKNIRKTGLKSNMTKSCGCLLRESNAKTRLPNNMGAVNTIKADYKRHAKNRNFEFTLTDIEFRHLVSLNCFYCEMKPSNTHRGKNCKEGFIYNGIDRLNSNMGYTLNNCVPCCYICNRAKMNRSFDEFTEWIKKAYLKNKTDLAINITNYPVVDISRQISSVVSAYKAHAKKKKCNFDLSYQELGTLISLDCMYCGGKPKNLIKIKNKQEFYYNGIDRKDYLLGYTLNNCVPCCKHCNYAKCRMSLEDFFLWINKVYNFLKNKGDIV